ncbi:RpmD, Ribosomal protein L30L7E [Pyrenophora tritici-repentis]|nr:mitochondrial 54s ribosomal protein 33 [Pyrenophora tritici-repentis]PZC96760.1 RpmD, Ribosomal protein L30 L7E [Pyrenophora tritici-repentis]PZD37937.1 RpmD, Ribosomal protein L30L7E [Pyrenophora tritici-repentis]
MVFKKLTRYVEELYVSETPAALQNRECRKVGRRTNDNSERERENKRAQDGIPYQLQQTNIPPLTHTKPPTHPTTSPVPPHAIQPNMPYFRITLMRSGIGMPQKTQGVLHALGLRKRMTTVYHPVSQSVAGQIMRIKELVDVKEVEYPKTKEQMRKERRPEKGYYVEMRAGEAMGVLE